MANHENREGKVLKLLGGMFNLDALLL